MFAGCGRCEIAFPKDFFPTEGFTVQAHPLYVRALVLGREQPVAVVSIIATCVSTVIGIAIGALVGYFGGMVDNVVMRVLDIIQAIPGMLLAIAIAAALGTGFVNTILALSIGGIPMTVRLLRCSIMSIRNQEYIEAAEKMNCTKLRTILVHILPN